MATNPHTPAPSSASGAPLPSIGFAPMPAVARVLAGFQRDQLAGFIEVALGLLDVADGDPDFENATDLEDDHALSSWAIDPANGPGCNIADTGEQAYLEWTSLHPGKRPGPNFTVGEEDDEDDDPDHALDEGEPNFVAVKGEGAGCSISDPDYGIDDQYQDEPDQDLEREQMVQDVPVLPVVTLDHNIFTDQRQPLGMSNLQSSFQCGQDGVLSADSGALFVPPRNRFDSRAQPGSPV